MALGTSENAVGYMQDCVGEPPVWRSLLRAPCCLHSFALSGPTFRPSSRPSFCPFDATVHFQGFAQGLLVTTSFSNNEHRHTAFRAFSWLFLDIEVELEDDSSTINEVLSSNCS